MKNRIKISVAIVAIFAFILSCKKEKHYTTFCTNFRINQDAGHYENIDSLIFRSADSSKTVSIKILNFEGTSSETSTSRSGPFCIGNISLNFESNWGDTEITTLKFYSSYNGVTDYDFYMSAKEQGTFLTQYTDWEPSYSAYVHLKDTLIVGNRTFYDVYDAPCKDTTAACTPIQKILVSKKDGFFAFLSDTGWYFKD